MAKILRFTGDLQAFASQAISTERTVFGDVTQSDVLDANINADFLRGWGIVGVNENPTKQDFNALAYTSSQLTAYLHQMGVAEWDSVQEYHSGSIAQHSGGVYISVSDSNTGNNPAADSGANWMQASQTVANNVTSMRGLTPVAGRHVLRKAHTTEGDMGRGVFRGVTGAAPATYTDNNGTVILPTGGDGSAAWLWVPDAAAHPGLFGATGDGADDTTPIHAFRDYLAAESVPGRFLPGTYAYTTSPNWAIQGLRVRAEGAVTLRNTGVGVGVIFDTGAAGNTFDVRFEGFKVEGAAATSHGVYCRSLHHSMIDIEVRGCGTSSYAYHLVFCVLSEFQIAATVNRGAWYTGAAPSIGLYLDERGVNEETTSCYFPNAIVEGVTAAGVHLQNAVQNNFIGGTSEGNGGDGVSVESGSRENMFRGMFFEANASTVDIDDDGDRNLWDQCFTPLNVRFKANSVGAILRGGIHDGIIDQGRGTRLEDFTYAQAGGALTLTGTEVQIISGYNLTTATFIDNVIAKGLAIGGGATIKKHLHTTVVTTAWTVPVGIPGVVSKTVTVPGAVVGDTVVVAANIVNASNSFLMAEVTAVDTVTAYSYQVFGTAVDPYPAGCTLAVDVWRH